MSLHLLFPTIFYRPVDVVQEGFCAFECFENAGYIQIGVIEGAGEAEVLQLDVFDVWAGCVEAERRAFELLVLVKQVMAREDLKYCPHGRPICVSLSKKQLEKQFKRS